MRNMNTYLSDVRDLAVPRLLLAEDRIKAWMPKLVWEERYVPRNSSDVVSLVFQGAPWGETYYEDGSSWAEEGKKNPAYVRLYQDIFAKHSLDMPQPFGDMIAFILIHELGHAICSCGHESKHWARACQEMGIKEEVYSKKGEGGRFEFRDRSLLQSIQKLSTYPGSFYAPSSSV